MTVSSDKGIYLSTQIQTPITLSCLYEHDNFIFGFDEKYIHIWAKEALSFCQSIALRETFGSIDKTNYKINALGTLEKLEEIDRISFIYSYSNGFDPVSYLKGSLIKFKVGGFKSDQWTNPDSHYSIFPPEYTSCVAMKNELIFYGQNTGKINVVSDRKMKLKNIGVLEAHSDSIIFMTVANDKLYSVSKDCAIGVWNIEKQVCEKIIECDFTITANMSLSLQGNKLLVYNRYPSQKMGSIELIDLDKNKLIIKLNTPGNWETCNLFDDILLVTTTNCLDLTLFKLDSFKTLEETLDQNNSNNGDGVKSNCKF